MNRVNEKLDAVEREKGEREYRERQCRLFLRTVTNLSQVATDDVKNARQGGERGAGGRGNRRDDTTAGGGKADLFLALVDKVIVGDGRTFVLRDGTEWTEWESA